MMMMSTIDSMRRRYYPVARYSRFSALDRVLEIACPEHRVLEIGCGDGRNSPDLRGRVRLYAGLDPDPRALNNPKLDRVRMGTAQRIPWPDAYFDIVFHHMVAEHLADPAAVAREIARVLKPGGVLLFETPNRWYYAMLVSRLTPQAFHERYVPLVSKERAAADVFPTFYRCNSRRQIQRALGHAGLAAKLTFIRRPPNYLAIHPVLFALGILYERTAEAVFPVLRATIMAEARKNPFHD